MLKEHIRSRIEKEALWQVHIPPPKKIDRPHCDVTKPNEQHQFDLVDMPHDVFEGNTYRYLLTSIDVALRYKVAKPLMIKKSSEVAFALGAILKKGGNFKFSNLKILNFKFIYDDGGEFKGEVTKLLGKHDVDIQRVTSNYKQTHTAFADTFYKELEKLLFEPIDAEELQHSKKVSTIWVKIMRKMNNTISSIIGMKPKDAIKLDTVPLEKTYPEETILPEDGLYTYLDQPGEQHGDQKRRTRDFIWSKNTYQLDQIVQEPGNRVLYYLQDRPDRPFVREELMQVSENTQVHPD